MAGNIATGKNVWVAEASTKFGRIPGNQNSALLERAVENGNTGGNRLMIDDILAQLLGTLIFVVFGTIALINLNF